MELDYSQHLGCVVLCPVSSNVCGCRPRVSGCWSRDPARPSAITRSQLSAVATRAPAPVRGVLVAAGTSSGGAGRGGAGAG